MSDYSYYLQFQKDPDCADLSEAQAALFTKLTEALDFPFVRFQRVQALLKGERILWGGGFGDTFTEEALVVLLKGIGLYGELFSWCRYDGRYLETPPTDEDCWVVRPGVPVTQKQESYKVKKEQEQMVGLLERYRQLCDAGEVTHTPIRWGFFTFLNRSELSEKQQELIRSLCP